VSRQSAGSAFAVLAAASLWGLWPVWVRSSGEGGAITATVSLGVAGVVAIPFAVREARARREKRAGRSWWWLVALAVVNAGNSWCYFRALEGRVAPAVLSHYLAPVIVAIFAPVFLREQRSSRTPAALMLALGGTALLLFGGRSAGGDTMWAVEYGAASATFYASAVLIAKRASVWFGDAEMFSSLAVLGSVMLVPLSGLPHTSTAIVWPAVGGVVSALVPGILYYVGLRRIPAERVAVLTYWEVPAAVVVGWIAYGETPARTAALGGAAILVAGGLVITAK
jgi:drug/metabolite transporter (DMT)-like permease